MDRYYELNGNSFKLLYYLKENNNCSVNGKKYVGLNVSLIMEKLKLSRSTLYRCLNELEEMNIIYRERFPFYGNRIYIREN